MTLFDSWRYQCRGLGEDLEKWVAADPELTDTGGLWRWGRPLLQNGSHSTCANVIGPGFWVHLPKCGKEKKRKQEQHQRTYFYYRLFRSGIVNPLLWVCSFTKHTSYHWPALSSSGPCGFSSRAFAQKARPSRVRCYLPSPCLRGPVVFL